MSAGAIVTIIVAVIAAVASVTGAIVAYRAAGRAANSSQQIARESHGVTAIDRQSDELREAFDSFVEAFAQARDLDKQLLVTARLDQLAACLGSSRQLRFACTSLADSIRTQAAIYEEITRVLGPPNFASKMQSVSTEYRNAQKALADKRTAALTDESK